MSDLKPCPFCGGNAIGTWFGHSPHISYYGECLPCRVHGPIVFEKRGVSQNDAIKKAIELWNTRAEVKADEQSIQPSGTKGFSKH